MRLWIVSIFVMALMFTATSAFAQGAPIVVLTPDSVTGEVTVRLSTEPDDVRYSRTCLFRIDANSPDPLAEVVCGSFKSGEPTDPADPTKGFIGTLTWTTVLVPSQDQVYVARNFADIGGGMEIVSPDSANSGLLPQPITAPLFVVRSP